LSVGWTPPERTDKVTGMTHISTRHPGSIDFEPTDLAEARRVLEGLPDGLVDATSRPEYWISRRRRSEPTDRALTGAAIDWMVQLPPIVQPRKLSTQYPRIANSLAEAWADKERCLDLLACLVRDQRGRRLGFPPPVQLEIGRLNAYRKTGR
jgi:hypothetical protein